MTNYDDGKGFDNDHQNALNSAVTPVPLDEARIQDTLRRARTECGGPRRRHRLAKVMAPMILLVLGAAGFWHWSGMNSKAELSFDRAIWVTQNPGDYSFENVRSAYGKIWKDVRGILQVLVQQGAITPEIRAALLDSIDSTEPSRESYVGGFEELSVRVKAGLAPEELTQLTVALRAGISAIRQVGRNNPAHAEYAQILCKRLRSQVTGEAAAGPAPNQEKRHD